MSVVDPGSAGEVRAGGLSAPLATALSLPSEFHFDAVHATAAAAQHTAPPALGPLANFKGAFRGHGFNTIFRPNNPQTPTHLPAGPRAVTTCWSST